MRHTYCALKSPNVQIRGFVEETQGSSSSAGTFDTIKTDIKDTKSPIVLLEVIPGANTEGDVDLLVVHEDGQVKRLSGDLQEQRWASSLSKIIPTEAGSPVGLGSVAASFLIDFEDAQRTLLKNREDVTAILDGSLSGAKLIPSVIIVVTRRSSQDFTFHVLSIPQNAKARAFGGNGEQLMHHLSSKLPVLRLVESHSVDWAFHTTTATLTGSFGQGFVSFDMSSYSPQISSSLEFPADNSRSFLRISARSVIAASPTSISVYDTHYQAIQANTTLESSFASSNKRRSIGGSAESTKKPIKLIANFARLGLIVGLRGTSLLGFDVTSRTPAGNPSAKPFGDGSLIDAIGRGVGAKGTSSHDAPVMGTLTQDSAEIKSTGIDAEWEALKPELDGLRMSSKPYKHAKFEALVMNHLAKKERSESFIPKPTDLPSATDLVEPEKLFYILSSIFHMKMVSGQVDVDLSQVPEPECRLTVKIYAWKLLRWLATSGRLTVNNVAIALRRAALPEIMADLPGGSLVRALGGSGHLSDLKNLLSNGQINLDATELVHAIKLLLTATQNIYDDETPKQLTNGTSTEIGVVNGSDTTSNLAPTTKSTITALDNCLKSLHRHPPTVITTNIRTILSPRETQHLIQRLRINLAVAGYSSRYTDSPLSTLPPSSPASLYISPVRLPLLTIADLLGSAIDALGVSGWISADTPSSMAAPTTSTEESSADMISEMRSEISAALAGVEEASLLKGFLHEYLRYGARAVEHNNSKIGTQGKKDYIRSKSVKNSSSANGNTAALTTITDETAIEPSSKRIKHASLTSSAGVYTFPSEDIATTDLSIPATLPSGALPLSLSATIDPAAITPGAGTEDADAIAKTKVRKGTGQIVERGKGEMRHLARKVVGSYSFERIVV